MPILTDVLKVERLIKLVFKECTPSILVVTDNLNFDPSQQFGLTEFVDTLRATTISGMMPVVTTAAFNPDPNAALAFDPATRHIANYKFTDATHGVLVSRYDAVFILSINGESGPLLTAEAGALDRIVQFMQGGGGLFATGDHEDLGAAMCKDIPRVRSMRYWLFADTPSAGDTDRLTTNLPGADAQYEFGDQSDAFPQRLHPNYRTVAGGVGAAHPLLQVPGAAPTRAIEVFPDHPHEGECIVPSNLATKLPDGTTDEWPVAAAGGGRVAPETVALTMSYGNAFPGKEAVTPRSFIAICAYDGQRADVGRVVTDATWHHFVNINIKPGMASLQAADLNDIRQYYRNLATWLMPKKKRLCRRFAWWAHELVRYPLFEELRPFDLAKAEPSRLLAVGALVEDALRRGSTRAAVTELVEDTLEHAVGPEGRNSLERLAREFGTGTASARDAGLAALGAAVMMTAETIGKLADEKHAEAERTLDVLAAKVGRAAVRRYLEHSRTELKRLDELIATLCR